MAPSSSETSMAAELKSLRDRLAQCELDKAALQSDVEMLCLQTTSNTTFNSSSVLQERILYTDKELASCRAALVASQAEGVSLAEDLRAVKTAHREASSKLRDAADRISVLDRELAFYQAASARAVADRDRTAYEAESLRERTLDLESRLADAQGRAATEAAGRGAAEARIEDLRGEVARLEVVAAEAAKVAGLREELATARATGAAIAAELEASREREREGERQLAEAAEAAEASAAAARAQSEALDRGREARKALEGELAELGAGLEAKSAQLAEEGRARQAAEESVGTLREEAAAREAALSDTRSSLEEVAAQKVSALLRLSEAEGLLPRYREKVQELEAALATARTAANGTGSSHSSPVKSTGSPGKGRTPPQSGWWGRSLSTD